MDKILTLCIATYNMEDYLSRCLSSITAPEIDSRLEVIVVNDGSSDKSLEIARKYEVCRPDIIKIIDKENGNYGSCVNEALKIATGMFFRMLDADDWFITDSLLKFLKVLEKTKADLVITNYTRHSLKGKKIITLPKNGNLKYEELYSALCFNVEVENCSALFCMHAMTYRLDIIKKSGLKHLEGISYTDTEYCYYPARYIDSLCFLNIDLYQYDMTRDGQTISVKSLLKSSKHIEMIAERMIKTNEEFKKDLPISSFFIKVIISFYYKSVIVDCPYVKRINDDLSQFDKKLSIWNNTYIKHINSLKANHLRYVIVWKLFGKSYLGKKIVNLYMHSYMKLHKVLASWVYIKKKA